MSTCDGTADTAGRRPHGPVPGGLVLGYATGQ